MVLSVEIRCSTENIRRVNSSQETLTHLSQSTRQFTDLVNRSFIADLNFVPLAP